MEPGSLWKKQYLVDQLILIYVQRKSNKEMYKLYPAGDRNTEKENQRERIPPASTNWHSGNVSNTLNYLYSTPIS